MTTQPQWCDECGTRAVPTARWLRLGPPVRWYCSPACRDARLAGLAVPARVGHAVPPPPAPPAGTCGNCGVPVPRGARMGRCEPCYQYYWRTGRERPDPTAARACRTCGVSIPPGARWAGQCHRCYTYARVLHRPRPSHLWDAPAGHAAAFAALLTVYWRADGRSVNALARAADCEPSTVSHLLSARRGPSREMVARLARALALDDAAAAALALAAGYAPARCPHCGASLEVAG